MRVGGRRRAMLSVVAQQQRMRSVVHQLLLSSKRMHGTRHSSLFLWVCLVAVFKSAGKHSTHTHNKKKEEWIRSSIFLHQAISQQCRPSGGNKLSNFERQLFFEYIVQTQQTTMKFTSIFLALALPTAAEAFAASPCLGTITTSRTPTFLRSTDRPDASAAIQEALEASKKYGPTSPEARIAWEAVEDIDAADTR